MKRRSLIKGLALLPVVGNVLSVEGAESVLENGTLENLNEVTLSSFMDEKNIYRSMGVEPIINCRGSFTIIGGSIKLPKVKEALDAASNNFVQLDELAEAVGKRLAELTKTEWGMVSSGCAAGVKHITAACVTGGSPERLIRIPDLTGFEKTEVIIPGDKYSFIPVPDKTKEVFENVIYNKNLILPPPVENFIDFKDITEEILLGWVETYGDLDVLKAEAHKTRSRRKIICTTNGW